MNKNKYNSNTAFLDLLCNMLLSFQVLFILSFLLINQSKSINDVENKAEFLITSTWAPESDVDVDLYVCDPLNGLVYFQAKVVNLMHLDRDDLGNKNDIINEDISYKENIEVVSIRKSIPGKYTVNLHCFSNVSDLPVKVKVKIEKLNPYKLILNKELELSFKGDEITVCHFKVDDKGVVDSIEYYSESLLNKKNVNLNPEQNILRDMLR